MVAVETVVAGGGFIGAAGYHRRGGMIPAQQWGGDPFENYD